MTYSVFYVLIYTLIFPFYAIAQTQGNITIGKFLNATTASASDSWLSPSGDFAFGFSEIESNRFLLSVWYDKIPNKTIVWYAYEGKLVESGSKVELTADKGLVLTSPGGEQLWKSEPVVGTISYAHMNDTGDFMIKDRDSRNLWASFDFPTDTILPFQTIERNGYLHSRKKERDFSPGRFRLTLLGNGNLVLSTINPPSTYLDTPYYYETRTSDDTSNSNSGMSLMFNESGYLYVLRRDNQKFMLTESAIFSTGNFYHRATIDFDGVFTQYSHPKNSTGDEMWSTLKVIPQNICLNMGMTTGSGVCGYNGICTLGTDQRPACECPPGYSFLDPNDTYGSCKPNFELGCGHETLQVQYNLEKLQNTRFPFSDYSRMSPFTESQCRDSCLNDCMCSVAVFHEDRCRKKSLPLSNGRKDSTVDSYAFVKVGKVNSSMLNPLTPPKDENDHDSIVVTGSVLLGTSALINLIFVLAICLGFVSVYKKKKIGNPQVETNLRCFTYKELVEATRGFNEELGRGSFGIVYKGEMKTSCGNLSR